MDKKEVSAEISRLIGEAQQLVWQAEALADEHDIGFSMSLGGYGMGGYYAPPSEVDEEDIMDGGAEEGEGFWHPSSQSC